jgi:hypothetical protein
MASNYTEMMRMRRESSHRAPLLPAVSYDATESELRRMEADAKREAGQRQLAQIKDAKWGQFFKNSPSAITGGWQPVQDSKSGSLVGQYLSNTPGAIDAAYKRRAALASAGLVTPDEQENENGPVRPTVGTVISTRGTVVPDFGVPPQDPVWNQIAQEKAGNAKPAPPANLAGLATPLPTNTIGAVAIDKKYGGGTGYATKGAAQWAPQPSIAAPAPAPSAAPFQLPDTAQINNADDLIAAADAKSKAYLSSDYNGWNS